MRQNYSKPESLARKYVWYLRASEIINITNTNLSFGYTIIPIAKRNTKT